MVHSDIQDHAVRKSNDKVAQRQLRQQWDQPRTPKNQYRPLNVAKISIVFDIIT